MNPKELDGRLAAVLDQIKSRHDAALAELSDFLRFPSVSADPARAVEIKACAQWLAGRISATGLTAEVVPTAGHPIVLARNEHQPNRPTVLLYGHYDVQPPEPLAGWITPPFEPTIRKTTTGTEAIFARGAADDKGQIWAHMEAISAWQSVGGGLPINLICLFEGEEEVDSHHLADFVNTHREKLRADIAVISDTNGFARGAPAITTGLRGLVYSEITLRAAANDLHSGIHGGAVRNPALALAALLARLHDESGRVTLDGFYDGVELPSDDERRSWAGLGFDEKAYANGLGLARSIETLGGEAGYTSLERKWARPTCDVCGLTSGYQGLGAKTIIPAFARAKISFRLVAGQDPLRVRAALEDFVRVHTPNGLVEIISHFAAAPAVLVDHRGRWASAAAGAIEKGFGVAPVFIREGLTIPVVNLLKSILGLDTLLLGFGLPDDAPHAPNEKFDLENLRGGAQTAAALYLALAVLRDAADHPL
ncbi:MAG: dipeptidase [Planctomycetota bacterium]|nr:dipeptidase [Planctomycetota bacterium]